MKKKKMKVVVVVIGAAGKHMIWQVVEGRFAEVGVRGREESLERGEASEKGRKDGDGAAALVVFKHEISCLAVVE